MQYERTRNWEDIIFEAWPLLRPVFFDKPYVGNSKGHRIIYDLDEATHCSTDDSDDALENWQGLLESVTPAWPEMPRKIERHILQALDQMTGKCYFSDSHCALVNNMQGDMARLMHCYAYGTVHQLWKAVQQAYLDGGMPCGWEGRYPKGRMLIFSNQGFNEKATNSCPFNTHATRRRDRRRCKMFLSK